MFPFVTNKSFETCLKPENNFVPGPALHSTRNYQSQIPNLETFHGELAEDVKNVRKCLQDQGTFKAQLERTFYRGMWNVITYTEKHGRL